MSILRRAATQHVVQNRLASMAIVIALLGGMVFTTTNASGQSVAPPGESETSEFVASDEGWSDLIFDASAPETSQDQSSLAMVAGLASQGGADCASEFVEPSRPVRVTGNVIWQTRDNQRIPAAFTEVCLFDGRQQPLGWSVTDKEGRFAINVESGKTGIYAVAYTSSGDAPPRGIPSVQVKKTIPGVRYELYSIESSQRVSTVGGAPGRLEVVASTNTIENRAFSVYQAMVRGFYAFEALLPAETDLETLTGYYPPPPRYTGTSYYPASNDMTVMEDDGWDWDVVHHELAHHVGTVTGLLPVFDGSVDTTHALKWNLSQTPPPDGAWEPRSLQDSMSLAWMEGFASYAAISMQQRLKVTDPVLNDIPTFGNYLYEDNSYNGTEVKPENRFSVISDLPVGAAPLPDNEVIVAQFLQSLDTYNPRLSNAAPLPWPVDDLVRVANKGGTVVDAFDAWTRLDAAKGLDRCAATDYGFGPQLVRASLDLTKGPHSVTIRPNGLGPNYPNTVFVLSFFDDEGDVIGQQTERLSATTVEPRVPITITISDKDWANLAKEGVRSWELTGAQTAAEARFKIPGCRRKIDNGAVAKLSLQPGCEAGTGALDGTLKNDGFETGEYLIAVDARPTKPGPNLNSTIRFERTVEPGKAATIKLGDLDDGAYVVTVKSIADDAVSAVSAEEQAQVKCTKALGRDYERNVSCLAANGRVDATLTNIYSATALYEVVVDNKFTRTMRIASKQSQRATVTGLGDGKHSLKITRTQILDSGQNGNTEQIADEEFSVTCDGYFIGSEVIDIRSWCENTNRRPNGHASIYAKNTEAVGSDIVVTTAGVAGAKQTVVEADGTALLEFKNLRDGKVEFVVKRNNIEIGRVGADIRCS